jgi:DNA-binding NtrC family response regulator
MILIVDNDPHFLGDATAFFTSKDERVLCALNAARAMDLVKNIGSEFGVVLVGLDLHDKNGFDLISAIREVDASLPIIAISGVGSNAFLERAKLFGAKETLRKPVDEDWLSSINRVRRYRSSDTSTPVLSK